MVIGLLVAGALAGALALVHGVVVRRRQAPLGADPAHTPDGPQGPGHLAFPADDELDRAFDAVLAAHAHELGDLLETRLHGLIARRVPVRAVRPAPGTHTARLCFADGTVVLARSMGNRELAAVVVGMQSGSVLLSGFTRQGRETRLDLRVRSGRPLVLLAIGLDQPD
ncbi:MAG: hypothetical protein M3Y71_05895 [Actinomycetota bacterium]|nr:hypothetical protein [Actinomycetota bacterium]